MGLTGAEIIAIEDSDHVGWVESATTIGEVNFQTLAGFVDNVLDELEERDMDLLHIQVHGSPSGVSFGDCRVTTTSFACHRPTLERLAPRFTRGAWVDLRACNVGQNLPLLHMFRRMWGVGIVAGRSYQSNLLDGNLGTYQVVGHDGREWLSATVPPYVRYDVSRRATRELLSHFG